MERFLVAMDGSPASAGCIQYIGRVLGAPKNVRLTLFHVLPTISPDVLKREEIRRIELLHDQQPDLSGYFWTIVDEERMNAAFRDAVQSLRDAGFDQAQITVRFTVQSAEVAQLILAEAKNRKCSTIVLGRRKQRLVKELLLGSVSHSVLRLARDLAVWIVPE